MEAIDCDVHSTSCFKCGADWTPGIRILDCDQLDCGFIDGAFCECSYDEDRAVVVSD